MNWSKIKEYFVFASKNDYLQFQYVLRTHTSKSQRNAEPGNVN